MVYKCLNGLGASYLSDLLVPYVPSRSLRSGGRALLDIPSAQFRKTRTHGSAAFLFYGAHLWNNLPDNLRTAETINTFKSELKTHLFNLAFD